MENFHDGHWCNLDISLKNHFRNAQTTWFERKLLGYVFYKSYKNEDVKIDTIDDFIKTAKLGKEIAEVIRSNLSKCWPFVPSFERGYTWEYFKSYILNFEDYSVGKASAESFIPERITFFIHDLLNITKNDSVACIGSGSSTIFEKLVTFSPRANYEIYEDEIRRRSLAYIYKDILGANVNFPSKSCMLSEAGKKYNKICLTYALGAKTPALREECSDYIRNYVLERTFLQKASLDWVLTFLLSEKLSRNGKMVSLTTFNKLSSRSEVDVKIRRELINSGKVEAVISLPANLLPHTSVSLALIVYSNDNKSVKFIDASNRSTSGYGFLYMKSKLNAFEYYDLDEFFNREGQKQSVVELSNFKGDYRLDPKYYISSVNIPYAKAFKEVIFKTNRRDTITKCYLEKELSNKKTDYRFVSSNDIQDGIICGEPRYISEKSEELQKMKKYSVGPGDIIISKNGITPKVAVVSDDEKFVLTNGNLYALKLKNKIIDPYFLQAFLESPTGRASLKDAITSGMQSLITVADLEDMVISCPPLKQQKEIAQRYKKKLQELIDLKKNEESKRKELSDVFDLK